MLVTVKKVFEDAAAVYYENGQGSFQNYDSILNLRPVLRNLATTKKHYTYNMKILVKKNCILNIR